MDAQKKLFIYTLRLKEQKRYVGKTTDLLRRLNEHQNGKGSAWTQKYEIVEIEDVITSYDPFDEDKHTKIAMSKYGIENVRGGSYVTVTLKPDIIEMLERELRNAEDCCVRCGSPTHYINKCPLRQKNNAKEKAKDKSIQDNLVIKKKSDDAQANKGARWKPDEIQSLISEFDEGKTTNEIAILHGRTSGAIEAKLASLGKIEPTIWYQKK